MNPSDDLTNTNASQASENGSHGTGFPSGKRKVIRWKRSAPEESSSPQEVNLRRSQEPSPEGEDLNSIQSEIESLLKELDSLDGELGPKDGEMSASQKAALSSIEERKSQESVEESVPQEDPEEVKRKIESLKQDIFAKAEIQKEGGSDRFQGREGVHPEKTPLTQSGNEKRKGVEHTYYDDLSKVMGAHDPKTMSELLQKSRFEERARKILSAKSRQNIFYIVGSLILIGAAFFLFRFAFPKEEQIEYVEEVNVPALVQAEKSTGVKVNTIGGERLKKAVKTLVEEKIPEKTIHHIYYAYVDAFGNVRKAGFHEVLQKLNVTLPGKIDKEVQEEFMHGVYRNGKNYPFLLLRVNSYDRAFEGMQEWEPDIIDDLGVFLDLPEEAYDRSLLEPGYSDELIRNKNARVARFLPRSVDREGSIEDIYPEETGEDGTEELSGEGESEEGMQQAFSLNLLDFLSRKIRSLALPETVFAQVIEAPQGMDEILVQKKSYGRTVDTSYYIQDLKIKRGGSNGIISGTFLTNKLKRTLKKDKDGTVLLSLGNPNDQGNHVKVFSLKDAKRRERFEIDGSRIFDSNGNIVRSELVLMFQPASGKVQVMSPILLRPAIDSAIREGIILNPKGPADYSETTGESRYERTEEGNIRLKDGKVHCYAFEWECYDSSGNPVSYRAGDDSQFCIKKVNTDRVYGEEVLDANGNPKGNYICSKSLGGDVLLGGNLKSDTYICYPAQWECRDPQGVLIPRPTRDDVNDRSNTCIKYPDRKRDPIYDNTGALLNDLRYHCTPYSGGGVMDQSEYKDTVGGGSPDIIIEPNIWEELLGMVHSNAFIGLKCNLIGTNCRYEDPSSIEATQAFLKATGLMDTSSPTGELDVLTQDILSDFQSINGLDPTGVIDADTASLITSITQALAGGQGVQGNASLYGGSGVAAINDYLSGEQLGLGAYNEQVQELQVYLYGEGYPIALISGFYDDGTCEALKQYQESHGLPVSDDPQCRVNDETLQFINSEIEKKGYIGSGFKLDGENLLGFGVLEGRYGPGSASVDLMYEDDFEKGDIVLIYTFLDEHTILITTHEVVIDEIIRRRALSQLFK